MPDGNRGQVLVIFALLLLVLLGFAALAIDVGHMYSVRHELQRSADSGALAGASAFTEGGWDNNDPANPTMAAADQRAREYASKDVVSTAPLNPAAEVAVHFDRGIDRVRVVASRNVPLFFARVLGMDNYVISAQAVAEASVAESGVQCLKPWGIPVPWNDFFLHTLDAKGNPTDNNRLYDSGEPVTPIGSVTPGTPIILKVGEPLNNPNNLDGIGAVQQEAGHFFALSMCGDTGGNEYRQRIAAKCLDDCAVSEGDAVDLKTGNTVGPTRQGVDQLIAQDPNAVYVEGSDPPEVNGSAYEDWRQSPRMIRIPLYDPSEMLRQGSTQMHVVGFGGFWLKGYDSRQGTVIGYYVPDASPGSSGSSGPSEGSQLKTLRLVE
jgi:hypothetical protein